MRTSLQKVWQYLLLTVQFQISDIYEFLFSLPVPRWTEGTLQSLDFKRLCPTPDLQILSSNIAEQMQFLHTLGFSLARRLFSAPHDKSFRTQNFIYPVHPKCFKFLSAFLESNARIPSSVFSLHPDEPHERPIQENCLTFYKSLASPTEIDLSLETCSGIVLKMIHPMISGIF